MTAVCALAVPVVYEFTGRPMLPLCTHRNQRQFCLLVVHGSTYLEWQRLLIGKASDRSCGLWLTGGSWIDDIFRQRYCRLPILHRTEQIQST